MSKQRYREIHKWMMAGGRGEGRDRGVFDFIYTGQVTPRGNSAYEYRTSNIDSQDYTDSISMIRCTIQKSWADGYIEPKNFCEFSTGSVLCKVQNSYWATHNAPGITYRE